MGRDLRHAESQKTLKLFYTLGGAMRLLFLLTIITLLSAGSLPQVSVTVKIGSYYKVVVSGDWVSTKWLHADTTFRTDSDNALIFQWVPSGSYEGAPTNRTDTLQVVKDTTLK